MAVPLADSVYAALFNTTSPMDPTIRQGDLVRFSYAFHKPGHDPTPLVIITDVNYKNAYVRGVNIHYLTFPVIKGLLQQHGNNPAFSYSNIKGNEYITSAFRQYKRQGIRQIRKLDVPFLLNVLASVRTFSPNEVEAIRRSVREQINRLTNPVAAPSVEMPVSQNPIPQPNPGVQA